MVEIVHQYSQQKKETGRQCLEACMTEIAQILCNNTPLKNHHSRRHRKRCTLADDGAYQFKNCLFFVQKVTGVHKGRARQVESCVGKLSLTKKQASCLGVLSS